MKLITAQTEWFAELPEVKAHLEESTTDNDAYIQELIYAVQAEAEDVSGMGLNEATWEVYYDKFPTELEIWLWPVASIESVKYTDADGATQTVSSSNYATDVINKPARIVAINSYSWPDTLTTPNAVQVQFKTGFTSPSVIPADLKQALYMILADRFEFREDRGRRFPRVAEKILNRYKYR